MVATSDTRRFELNDNNASACYLPTEILREVFLCALGLSTRSRQLYPCVFVCRRWCAAAMPLLWSKPFTGFDDLEKVLELLLALLDDSQRAGLWVHGVALPRKLEVPAFPYPKFLRHLDYTAL